MKGKNKKLKMSNYIKMVSIAACSVLVIFFGGCTYAHVNGTETIISPLLRNLGINSKYEEKFNKVATIPVDISKAVEKSEENSNWKQYKNENYSFKYNENWTLTTKVDSDKVGPNSAYLGALQLEIPSTTNSEYTSSIYVSTVKTNTTLDEYVKQQKELNSQEDINEKNTKEIKINNNKAYQVTSESTDGENGYIMQQTFLSANGNIYTITFFGDEKEYNNLKTDINQFINGFEI